jgi:hypothetical protein
MDEPLVERENSVPDLPLIVMDVTYCEWELSCPRRYCDRGILRVLGKERCLIFERALYKQTILDNHCTGNSNSSIEEKL